MTKKDFMKWVEQMDKKVDYKRYFSYLLPDSLYVTVCYDKKTGRIGVAKCRPKDRCNMAIGKAISYARCVGIEIPKVNKEKRLDEMNVGDKFYDYHHGKICEHIFLGKRPDVSYDEYLAFPKSDKEVLQHYSGGNIIYEMVE